MCCPYWKKKDDCCYLSESDCPCDNKEFGLKCTVFDDEDVYDNITEEDYDEFSNVD